MKTEILVIGVIQNDNLILLRKKPSGSMPYQETWYLFGGSVDENNSDPEKVLKDVVKKQTGIEIELTQKLSWDTEIKPNHKGEKTSYIYLDYLCKYISGNLDKENGIEELKWVSIEKLAEYDLVPPSVKVFKRLGWIK